MDQVWTVAQMRQAESEAMAVEPCGGAALMQRAAAAVATHASKALREAGHGPYGADVLVLAGPGNNGADALYAAVRLAAQGVRVWLRQTSERVHSAAWQAAVAAGGRVVDHGAAITLVASVDLVIDGVLGLGGRPGLPAAVADVADACRSAGTPVLAVDVPSGLAADLPRPTEPSFVAAITITFAAAKLCHVAQPAAGRCGRVEIVDIGLRASTADVQAWTSAEVAAQWPRPDSSSEKYSRGVVILDTGSQRYPGAAVLSVAGAGYAGAGMIRFAGASSARELIMNRFPHVVMAQGRGQAHVLGSGWGDREDAEQVVNAALNTGLPLVIDADALAWLPADGCAGVPTLLTPHAGELAGLLRVPRRVVESDPVAAVREVVQRTGATVLLKGATQYVAAPASERLASELVELAVPGPAWTAQAGSGDVLAGMCGALLAAGKDPATAAGLAASTQAMAAQRRPGPVPPTELAASLPGLISSWQ